MKKKSLLFTITQFYRGGAEVALLNLFRSLDPRAYNVDFLILLQPDQGGLIPDIPRWINVCNAQLGEEGIARRFVEGKCYAVAFSYGEWCPHRFVANRVRAKVKSIWIHTDIANSSHVNCHTFFKTFGQIHYYIFVSESSMKNALEKFPFIVSKAVLIHNILNQQDILRRAREEITEMPSRSGYTFVTVANVRHEKGYVRMLETAVELVRRGMDFTWICVGNFSDPMLAQQIIERAEENGVGNRLKLIGARENPHQYTALADVFVLLSDYEAWPLSIAEAQIIGKPVVATQTSGAQEHIQDGINGVLCEFDPIDIADRLESLLTAEVQRGEMARWAKKYVATGHDEFSRFLKTCAFNIYRDMRRTVIPYREGYAHDIRGLADGEHGYILFFRYKVNPIIIPAVLWDGTMLTPFTMPWFRLLTHSTKQVMLSRQFSLHEKLLKCRLFLWSLGHKNSWKYVDKGK